MYKLITAPTNEPLLLGDAKNHLRIAHTSMDTMIDVLIKSARYQFESDVPSIQLMPATWTLYLDDWPNGNFINIKKYPLTAISSIKYYAEGETTLSTWAITNYDVDLVSYPGRILILGDYPELNEDKLNNVQITFTCGYADSANVPGDIISALKLLIGHLFENPQQVMTGTQVNELPFGYRQIVANYTKDWV
jgi:uncharacterized phiE125 gp8 family phage protein